MFVKGYRSARDGRQKRKKRKKIKAGLPKQAFLFKREEREKKKQSRLFLKEEKERKRMLGCPPSPCPGGSAPQTPPTPAL